MTWIILQQLAILPYFINDISHLSNFHKYPGMFHFSTNFNMPEIPHPACKLRQDCENITLVSLGLDLNEFL